MDTVLLYITAPHKEAAERLAHALLDARLIACANIVEGITSLYGWEGKREQTRECLIFAKTTAERAAEAVAKAKEIHPYACPCIAALPISMGYEGFLGWIAAETAHSGEPPVGA